MFLWHAFSILASMSVMGPAGVAIGIWLAVGGFWRLAINWALLFGAGMALVVITKLVFMGWGIGIEAWQFTGFSGHAMRSAAVLPVAFYVGLINVRRDWRWAGVAVGVALALLMGYSRIAIGVHSVSEVVLGSMLGLAVAAAFIWSARESGRFTVSRSLVLASLCLLAFTPRVEQVPTEALIGQAALHLSGHPRLFTRADWAVAEKIRPAH